MTNQVWVILQQREGKLHRGSWEAIAAAQRLAAATGGGVEAVLLGHGVGAAAQEVAGKAALAALHVVDHARLADYTPGGYVGALSAALRAAAPRFVVAPHTYQTVDYLPRLAHAIGAGVLPEVIAFAGGADALEFKRPVLGGKMHAKVRITGSGCVCLSVQAGAFAADSLTAGTAAVTPLAVDAAAIAADREILGVEEVGGDTVDLSKAEIIVAVGRGIGGQDKMGPVEELAKLLGAEIGASRPVIDSGWLARDRQIGSSGQTVAPKLYIAAGISGAIQHLVGMKAAGCIVAINKDPGAPIFGVSHYGIVGDLHEVVPALTKAILEARSS